MAPPRVVVLGAGGKTGAACVEPLAAQQTPAVAVVRDPSKYESLRSLAGVELVPGGVTDKEVRVGQPAGLAGRRQGSELAPPTVSSPAPPRSRCAAC